MSAKKIILLILFLFFICIALFDNYSRKFYDHDKICEDSSECLSGYCLAKLSVEQKQMYKTGIDFKTSGKCTSGEKYFGCFPFVNKGNVSSKNCPPGTISF